MQEIYKRYTNQIIEEQNKEDELVLEMTEMVQLNEFVFTAIASILIGGIIIRVLDGFIGNKPKLIHYISALFQWATEEYDGSINPLEIRKYAWEKFNDEKEVKEYSNSISKQMSNALLKGVKKSPKVFSKIIGTTIGYLAKRAKLSKQDLDKIIPKNTQI